MLQNSALFANWPGAIVRRLSVLVLATLMACSAPALAVDPETDAPASASPPDPIRATAEWMSEQAEPRLRAAALVVLAERDAAGSAEAIIDAVRGTTDGAAMLWLAHACQAVRIQRQCIDAGLDDAIVRYDSANLFARAALDPEEDIADLVLATRGESMHYFALVEAWYDAWSRAPAAGEDMTPGERLGQAFAIAAAWAIPSLAPLAKTCRSATPGAELDRACQQLAGRMVDGGESMLGFMIGRAIQRRGEPAGDEERAAATLASDRAACQMAALEPELMAMDDAGIREFIGLLKRHGEFEAWDRLAERQGVDCSEPDSRSEQAEMDRRQFETAIETVARKMLASDTDRERAAGLAYLLTADHPVELSEDRLLEALESRIERTTDGAALSWLASGCRQLRIEAFCIEAGLDDAIIEHDRGNLLSRLHLLDRDAIEQALRSDPVHMQSHASELVLTWYAAIAPSDLSKQIATPQDRVGFAMAYSWSTGSPNLGPLDRVCSQPSPDLDTRCRGLAERLAREGRTAYERLFAIEVLARRAEAEGNTARAERLVQMKTLANTWMQCRALEDWMNGRAKGPEATEASLADLVEYGEWIAMRRAAERLGTECEMPPSIDEVLDQTR